MKREWVNKIWLLNVVQISFIFLIIVILFIKCAPNISTKENDKEIKAIQSFIEKIKTTDSADYMPLFNLCFLTQFDTLKMIHTKEAIKFYCDTSFRKLNLIFKNNSTKYEILPYVKAVKEYPLEINYIPYQKQLINMTYICRIRTTIQSKERIDRIYFLMHNGKIISYIPRKLIEKNEIAEWW